MSAALELNRVACARGKRMLFSDVSASVAVGQMLRVLGDNGAGKTRLLRMICGLANPAQGAILWHGHPIAALRHQFDANLVYLGHAPTLKEDLSAIENLQASLGPAGKSCSDREASAALAQSGLAEREWLPVRALSKLQRRQIDLARLVLCQASALWVLDEPFTALDATACGWLQQVIAEQLARGGVVVLTSHEGRAWEATQPNIAITLRPPALAPSQLPPIAGSS